MKNDIALFSELCEILLTEEKENPVALPIPTDKLFQTLDLNLSDTPALDSDLKNTLIEIIKRTPKTASRAFFNQLFGGRMSKATLGDLLAVMLNNSMYTYKVAGPQVGIEMEIIKKICRLVEYPEQSNGTLAPGGSMTNMMAMLMARDAKCPNIRTEGSKDNLIVYTSEASHYSISKNAALAGIGKNNVRMVNTDQKGKLLTNHLEELINKDRAKGNVPFFVNATAGTTVLGAFDDIEAISKVCKAFRLWLHVDGAYCGGVIFSKRYKHLTRGVQLSDSFSINAHKMLGTPLGCSIIVTKHKEQLHHSFSNEADYLYQTDGDDYNLGKTSIQCGRRNDALKLWTLWKSLGTNGLEELVNKQFELAEVARNYIKEHPGYTLESFDNSISVCFNYKGIEAKELCTELYEKAQLMVGFGSFRDKDFVRMVTINSVLEKEDIFNFFATLETFVESRMPKLIENVHH